MNRNFRKWLACAVAVTIAVYNAPYSVEALEVIKDSVQVDNATSSEDEHSEDISQPEDNGVQSGDKVEDITEEDANDKVVEDGIEEATEGDFIVSGTKGGWSYDNKVLTINDSAKDITIKGNESETDERIVVASGFDGNITIENLKINAGCAFEIQTDDNSSTNANLILEGDNTLKSGDKCPGLKFEGEGNGSSLTISGEGKLEATGGISGAGIGGGKDEDGNNITITGGTITALGGEYGAGIGGGNSGNSGSGNNITITGGTVTAIGANGGAGIGGGNSGSGNNITITGGMLTATGGKYGAGIGGGQHASGSNITIAGGTVTATGGTDGAGIGGGQSGSGNNITITGGTVTVIGAKGGAGIGGGYNGSGSNIVISGGSVNASSISDKPTNKKENVEAVYLVKLDNQGDFKEGNTVIVSGQTESGESINDKDYKVASNHPDNDNSFYLYMPEGTYTVTTHKGVYRVKVTANRSFVTPTPDPNNMTVTNTNDGIIADVSVYPSEYGPIMCSLDGKDWVSESEGRKISLGTVGENDSQTIYIKYGGKDTYLESKSSSKDFKIEKITITGTENLSYTGKEISSISINGNSGADIDIKYYYKNNENKLVEISKPINAGSYKVKVILEPNDRYTGAIVEKEFTITKAKNEWKKGRELKIENSTYGEKFNEPTAKAEFGDVKFTYSASENEGYTENLPTNAGTYYVKATVNGTTNYTGLESNPVQFEILRADTKLSFEQENIGKSYDGKPIYEPKVNIIGNSNKDITFTWFAKNGESWSEPIEAPTNAGEYKIVASVKGDTNYNEASIEKEFIISQAVNKWTTELSIEGWKYKENPKDPTAKALFGDVTFTYSSEENGIYKSEVPTNAGTYYVKATVVGTDNYAGLTATKPFTISQAEFPEGPEEGGKIEITVPEWVEGNETQKPTVTIPEGKPEGETFTVEYRYKKYGADDSTYTTDVPTEAGKYTLKIEIKSANYIKTITKDFTIYGKAPEITGDTENVDTSTDKIEINTGVTEGNKDVYFYCTESTKVPNPPVISSKFRKVDEWEKANGSKHVFTGLKSNTTYHVWKYDDNKTENKLTYEYSIKTDSPSTPSIPSKPEEKPDTGVDVEIVDKIAGENRYDTSVSISQKVYPSKSEKVYLVSGEKFPDALSSAALTGKGDGPILLINDKNIDKILSEIDRLDAKEIVFIGGNSISDANEAKIRKFAKENSSVVKSIVGKDRYETAVKVAEETISKYGNKGKVIIADGRNYPDAVSIASYAAKEGIPVILVNGNKVPDVVKNLLNKYKIKSAIIVGGDKAVGKDVEKLFKSVDRVAGDDRYDTSKKIAEKFFAGSKTVFVASGESFADSLSVSYYAGAKNAPILLTKANSLDNDTKEYLEKNKNKDYIIVGGDKAVNPDLFK